MGLKLYAGCSGRTEQGEELNECKVLYRTLGVPRWAFSGSAVVYRTSGAPLSLNGIDPPPPYLRIVEVWTPSIDTVRKSVNF